MSVMKDDKRMTREQEINRLLSSLGSEVEDFNEAIRVIEKNAFVHARNRATITFLLLKHQQTLHEDVQKLVSELQELNKVSTPVDKKT